MAGDSPGAAMQRWRACWPRASRPEQTRRGPARRRGAAAGGRKRGLRGDCRCDRGGARRGRARAVCGRRDERGRRVATRAVAATPDGPRILRRVRRAARARRRACGHALALASVRVGWHACCDAGRAARPPPGARGEPAAALGGARWPWRASGRAALRSPASYAGCAARGEPGAAPGDWPWNGAGWGVAWGHAGYGQGGGCSQQS